MAKDSDLLADAFGTKETSGLFSGFLAEESGLDRHMLWRLGTWGVVAVGAVVVAVMANQAQLGWRRDQVASIDLARQADRIQMLTRESQNEARRLAAAIETLNSDRDRLYSRVTALEQGLDSVTGAIARQNGGPAAAAKPQDTPATAPQPAPAPSLAPVASTPAPPDDKPRAEAAKDDPKEVSKEVARDLPGLQTAAAASLVQQSPAATSALPVMPLLPARTITAPPEPAEQKPDPAPSTSEVVAAAARPPEAAESEPAAIAVQQTRFAIDLGAANSIDGLRALWRGLIKSNPEVAALRPIIMIREGSGGLGLQLRLGAGPLVNAAAAARLCAGLAENDRRCETTVFDGQRLSMRSGQAQEKSQDRVQEKTSEKSQDAAPQSETAPAPAPNAKPDKHRRSNASKRTKHEEPAPAAAQPAAPAKPETASAGSSLSSFFRR
jgi:hypothetical protein